MSLSDAFRVLLCQMLDGTEPFNKLFARDLHHKREFRFIQFKFLEHKSAK